MRNVVFVILGLILAESIARAQSVSAPGNLIAALDSTNTQVNLSWKPSSDKIAGYNLFVKKNDNRYLLWGKAGLIPDTTYSFNVIERSGSTYSFKVCSVKNFPEVIRSDFSNQVSITIPSSYLPMVKMFDPKIRRNEVEISWDYSIKAMDLEGFILLINEEEIRVVKEKRRYTLTGISDGDYTLQVLAITASGLKSVPSIKKFIRIK